MWVTLATYAAREAWYIEAACELLHVRTNRRESTDVLIVQHEWTTINEASLRRTHARMQAAGTTTEQQNRMTYIQSASAAQKEATACRGLPAVQRSSKRSIRHKGVTMLRLMP